jgi:FxsC-like protein
MTDTGDVREEQNAQSSYFFLSYAHSDPLAGSTRDPQVGQPQADPDQWVEKFFSDLMDAVARHASRRSHLILGFFDQKIPVASDWKESLSRALSAAETFVPLYSAGYLARSWPGREWACFHGRMQNVGLENPVRRFVPVLWTPLAEGQDPPGLQEALALSAAEPDYRENGLRALLKISPYHDSYQAVVNIVAEQIVVRAEESPVGQSDVPDIDGMASPFTSKPHLAVFAVQTAAPTVLTSIAGHDPIGYGRSSTQWRPFPQQETLAEYVARVAERFDFEVLISGIEMIGDKDARRPGIILIDPWFIADDKGRQALRAAIGNLPRWVLPLLVLGQPGDVRTQELAGQVRDMLGDARVLPTESSRRAARGVSSLNDFVSIVPVLVAEAERQYIRYRSGRIRSSQLSRRPRLGSAGHPDAPTSTTDPLGEAPDA